MRTGYNRGFNHEPDEIRIGKKTRQLGYTNKRLSGGVLESGEYIIKAGDY
jgi:hypothetical protein